MKKILILIITLILFVSPLITNAQNEYENTYYYDSVTESPKATIEDIAWLAGHWQGEAFGGIVEELWSPPLGGTMMGAFKLVADEKVQFYELETISEEHETLILRLKHFGANLKGWEEKEETVDFELVLIMKNKIFFNGFTIEKISEDEINMYVLIDYEGNKKEMKFAYKRMK